MVRRYRRSKDGGPLDVREVVAQGFREVCGASIGPDGWLYLSAGAGDNDIEGSDGSRATVLRSGGVFRCRPDGSKMQAYAIGLLNPVGAVAFDGSGDLFHIDNGNHSEKGAEFAACRLMHVVEGADFGYRTAADRNGAGPAAADAPDGPRVVRPACSSISTPVCRRTTAA